MTAVEWLYVELERIENTFHSDSTYYIDGRKKAIKQAKKMENQQIIDAYIECKRQYVLQENCYPPQFIVKEAEQYYNEKFQKTLKTNKI